MIQFFFVRDVTEVMTTATESIICSKCMLRACNHKPFSSDVFGKMCLHLELNCVQSAPSKIAYGMLLFCFFQLYGHIRRQNVDRVHRKPLAFIPACSPIFSLHLNVLFPSIHFFSLPLCSKSLFQMSMAVAVTRHL